MKRRLGFVQEDRINFSEIRLEDVREVVPGKAAQPHEKTKKDKIRGQASHEFLRSFSKNNKGGGFREGHKIYRESRKSGYKMLRFRPADRETASGENRIRRFSENHSARNGIGIIKKFARSQDGNYSESKTADARNEVGISD